MQRESETDFSNLDDGSNCSGFAHLAVQVSKRNLGGGARSRRFERQHALLQEYDFEERPRAVRPWSTRLFHSS